VKDFSFDLGLVVVLCLIFQWFLKGASRRVRILALLPPTFLFLAGARYLPELWAYPILSVTRTLAQDACAREPALLVVLGGGMAGPDDLAVSTVSRVRHAAHWMSVLNAAQKSRLKVVFSGGPSLAGVRRPESELMIESFRAWRPEISEENLIAESESLNTRDNAVQVAKLFSPLSKQEQEGIALVTSELHMPRAVGAFRSVGLSVCPVPSAGVEVSSEGFLNFRNGERTVRVLNEYAGLLGYGVAGWLNTNANVKGM
jgi:uncharacterized SAM-binding protein YcdF (DUF218 family)